MKRRDKLYLVGTFVLLASVGTTAMLIGGRDSLPIGEPTPAPVIGADKFGVETQRTIAKMPGSEEIPQEFKEAENYLLDRWGHMEDAGLAAPGIMPEGDMYFQDRRVLAGVRGNGKPIYAKTYLRLERFRGPVANKNSGLDAALDSPPAVKAFTNAEAQAKATISSIKKRSASMGDYKDVANKLRPIEDIPGSQFRPRGDGTDSSPAADLGGND